MLRGGVGHTAPLTGRSWTEWGARRVKVNEAGGVGHGHLEYRIQGIDGCSQPTLAEAWGVAGIERCWVRSAVLA